MKRNFFLLTIVIFLLGFLRLEAQNVLFFTSKQGLANSRVRNITEDSRRNIWITTQNGLNRYDGVKLNSYTHQAGNPYSLMYDETTCVVDFEKGKVLVGTGAGVQVYDYATDRFTTVPFVREGGDSVKARVVSICKVRKSIMVCYAGYGCGELQKDENGNYRILRTDKYDTDGVSPVRFYVDKGGQVWMVNGKDNLFRQTLNGWQKYQQLHYIRNMCESSSGKLYVGSYGQGVYVYNSRQDRFDQVATKEELGGAVLAVSPWTAGRMFFCVDGGGVRVYEERTKQIVKNTITVKDFDMSTSNVTDAIYDSFGNVWVSVYMKGVVMKPINQSAFEYVGQNSITKNTVGKNSVFFIAGAKNMADGRKGIWAAPDNDGLYLLSADGKTSKHWSVDTNPRMPHAFTCIYDPAPAPLLLGSFYDGLWQMKDGNFSNLTREINHIFDIKPAEEKDCYWVATMGDGIYYYNRATGEMKNYNNQTDYDVIGNPYVYTMLLLKDRLFVGTADGLRVCYPGKDGVIEKKSTIIPNHSVVRHFALSADGKAVWAATNQGLLKIDRNSSKIVRTFTTADGLPNNSITSVCVDGKDLWLGTDFGLSCMDTEKETFTNFFADDGLQDNEFSRGAVFAQDGKLYFSGIGGITFFDTEAMKHWQGRKRNLRLRLVDVLVGGKIVHQGDLSGGYDILKGLLDECERIDLCSSDNHFTLEMCVEGLSNQHVTYEYSIDGGPWMDQGGNNDRVIFDNMQPGTYRIKLRAKALDFVTDERELIAVVHSAWYASWWAKLIYLLLFFGMCWLAYEYVKRQVKLRRIMRRNRQQRELNEARMQFFMNISHEIRTPMTLILAPLAKLIGRDNDPERQRNYRLMKQNLDRILRLINQMMDVRKIEQGKFLLDYQRVDMVELLQNIFDVFQTNAQSRNITYVFEHEEEHLHVYVDPDNMDKIVMNLLSNSFKFTPDGGRIILKLTCSEADRFEVSVRDTGVGIPEEEKKKVFERFYSAQHQNGYIGTGIGLNLTSLLVRLHKGTIDVEDNPDGRGAIFTVRMPAGDESLRVIKQDSTGTVADSMGMSGDECEQVSTASLLSYDKPADTHHKNALLVEDDEAIRQYVESELSADLVVTTCGNGQEAWDYIVAHPNKVDIVISDIMMPVMDGMTFCQKLKSNFTTNHIPIVLMTALGSDADRIAGITNGADAYVSKPFNIDVLKTTVVQLLKTRLLLQGKYHGDKQQEENIDKIEIESPDEHLMKRVMKVINENMDNPELSVEVIADKVGISRVHFYRKMKDLTGQAPRDFVKYVRLKEAARLLSEKDLDITGVSVATGFKSLSAFSTSFKALFGLTPSEWVKQHE